MPLLLFWFISFGHSLTRLQIGIYVGIAALAGMAVARLSRGVILWAMAVFFAFALVSCALLENRWSILHIGVFPGAILFAGAMLSMIAGHPFVQDYARDGVPAAQQESASFVRACFVLTSFWSAVFLVLALLNAVKISHPGPGGLVYLLIQLAVLVSALAFQAAYATHARRRRLAAGG